MITSPITSEAKALAISAVAASYADPLVAETTYLISSTVDAWFAIGPSAVAAVASDGSWFLPAGTQQVLIGHSDGDTLSVIAGAAGTCVLAPASVF